MPAKDMYHDAVRRALEKDGWTITDDPLRLVWTDRDMYVDLGAEQLVAATLGDDKIAVEIKSFVGDSEIADLQKAMGQYVIYHDILEELEPDRVLYLAIRRDTYEDLFDTNRVGEILLQKRQVRLIVFNADSEEIVQWIP